MHTALSHFNPCTFWLHAMWDNASFFAPHPDAGSTRNDLPMTRVCRDYSLYVPQKGSGRSPMVVMLHGMGQTPAELALCSGMNHAAEMHGFVVLYPAQSAESHGRRCWQWYEPAHQSRARGEPAAIAALALSIRSKLKTNPAKLYIAGLSAGGAMAALVGELFPEIFAAVGVHSGLAAHAGTDLPSALAAMRSGGKNESGPSGMPTIVFHGDCDKTVNMANGHQIIAAAVGKGCPVKDWEKGEREGRRFTRQSFRSPACSNSLLHADHWTIHGSGHAWSGGGKNMPFAEPHGPNASEEMLKFFKKLRLNR